MDETLKLLYPFFDTSFISKITVDAELTGLVYNSVLALIPVTFILIFTPFELWRQTGNQVCHIPWNFMNSMKVILLCIQSNLIIMMALYEVFHSNHPSVFNITVQVILFLTQLHLLYLVKRGKKKGAQTSYIMCTYWLIQTTCSIIDFQSNNSSTFDHWKHKLKCFSFVINVFQLIIATGSCSDHESTHHKDNPLIPPNICPEDNCSIVSKLSFWWLNPLMRKGYERSLTREDLWCLVPNRQCKKVSERFESYWEHKPNFQSVSRPHIIFSLLKTFWLQLLFGAILKLASATLMTASPKVLSWIIQYMASDGALYVGVYYACMLFVVMELSTLFHQHHCYQMNSVAFGCRSSLICAIYKKAHKISPETQKRLTIGEMINVLSNDTQQFVPVMPSINLLWCSPLEILIVIYFLWQILGLAIFAGVLIMVIMIPINGLIEKVTQKVQVDVLALKDERIKIVTEIMNGIRILKLYAWETPYMNKVVSVREREMNGLKKIAYLNASTMLTWYSCPFLVSIGTFATYIYMSDSNILTTEMAFVAVTLFSILRLPIIYFPQTISRVMKLKVSLDRINKFLHSEELDHLIEHDSSYNDPISVKGASFTWEKSSKNPVLKDISLTVAPNSLVAVIGKVGCGKSSLISALLGEMYKLKGQVNLKGNVAYVPQTAWIRNATVKENIIMYKSENQSKYEEILNACELQYDLDILPSGDICEIGEKGVNLSGGQKQRISLARAIYHEADVYFFDDPLSAVDSHVGKKIFENVISQNGLLKNVTRFMVTHNLSYLPYCDKILVVNKGTVFEANSYESLSSKNCLFSESFLQYLNEIGKIQNQPDLYKSIKSCEDDTKTVKSGEILDLKKESNYSKNCKSSHDLPKINSVNSSEASKFKLITEEKIQAGGVSWTVYYYYMKTVGLPAFFFLTVAWGLAESSFAGSRIWLKQWSDGLPSENFSKIHEFQYKKIAIYSLFGLAEAIFVFIASNGFAFVISKTSAILHENMLTSLMKSPVSFFDTTPVGRILNRFTQDMEILDGTLLWDFTDVIKIAMKAFFAVLVISVNFPKFLIIIILINLLYFYLQKIFIASSRQLFRLQLTTYSRLQEHYSESLNGKASIRAYKLQNEMIKETYAKIDLNQIYCFSYFAALRWLTIRTDTLGNISIFFVSMFAVLNKDFIDGTVIGLAISSAMVLKGEMNWLIRMISNLENHMVSAERVLEYSNLPSESCWNKEAPSFDWLKEGKIEFCSYSSRYHKHLDLSLRNITCCIYPGEKIGICGRTGAGKTSLSLALFRIIEAAEGKILIDGFDISCLGLHDLRSKLTIIPQVPTIFSGTLKQNIDPFEEYDELDIWRALKQSHMKSFVSSLKDGLQFQVCEDGTNLSVGQRQLMCMTRALLRKTKILILDEATAAVDIETDKIIQETIRNEFKECTILTIAHRLNTIMDSSRVMVLEHGEIAEFDSPSRLLVNKDTIFYRLAKDANLVTSDKTKIM